MTSRAGSKETLRAAITQVAPEIHAKWRQAFKDMDVDNSGAISAENLEVVMKNLNMVPSPGEIDAMIAAVDHNDDNMVDFEEFEMMMIAAGRGGDGAHHGFSHVVERFIRMSDIAKLITQECKNMLQVFSHSHKAAFQDLPQGNIGSPHENPTWYDTFQQFQEQAELTMQNLLLEWGVANQKSFEVDFIEAVGEKGELLDDFLRLLDYNAFLAHMQQVQLQGADEHPSTTARPEAHLAQSHGDKRLMELDQRLAVLDQERNTLMAERRRLVGCEVTPVTTTALRQVLEMRRWQDDVGND